MVKAATNQRWLRAKAADNRTFAPSRSVEPKHWHLAWARILAEQVADPERGASIPIGKLCVEAREVPQSAPQRADDADECDHRRHQGAKPVRFRNGQQWT